VVVLKVFCYLPTLKKPTLDKYQLSINKQINHLASIDLNRYQSAYCKHHSTETALLYIHHHLINAVRLQKSCLCLLNLYAARDTIYHNILITRLSSWFVVYEFMDLSSWNFLD